MSLKRSGPSRDEPDSRLDNILFATDFSPASEVGLRYALALARHYHGNIYMVPADGRGSGRSHLNDTQQKALAEARARAMGWVAELRLSGRLDGVRHELPVGEAAEKALPGCSKTRISIWPSTGSVAVRGNAPLGTHSGGSHPEITVSGAYHRIPAP